MGFEDIKRLNLTKSPEEITRTFFRGGNAGEGPEFVLLVGLFQDDANKQGSAPCAWATDKTPKKVGSLQN